MKIVFKIILLFLMAFTCKVHAQNLLTPDDAVAIALQKNFDIIIAKNDVDIAKINNNAATAGMMPKVNFTTSDAFNLNNINQKFTTGQEVQKNFVPINSFNMGVYANWTIFDGMKMYATKDKLATLQSLGELQLKNQIQNNIAQILNIYYDIVRQKQQINALKESANISLERVNLSQKKFDIGYSDKTPLLQAKIDYAEIKMNIQKQENNLKQLKIDLNQILGRSVDIDFDVIDAIQLNEIPSLNQLSEYAKNENIEIQLINKNIEVLEYQKKEIKSQRLPQVSINTGYGFLQSNSKAGLQLFNRSFGPLLGFAASVPLYNGGIYKKEIQVSDLTILSKNIELEKIKMDVDANILKAYQNYLFAQNTLTSYEENVILAKENAYISMQRFRLNQTNSLEIKEAQSSYETALYNVIAARYDAKIAEITLKKINNEFIQYEQK